GQARREEPAATVPPRTDQGRERDRGRVRARSSAPHGAGCHRDAVPATKTAIGIAVADLTDAQKKDSKLRGGVRVESVEGAAARAGLREGDVIVTLDNVEVVDAKQFNAQVAKLDKSKAVSVMVRRGDLDQLLGDPAVRSLTRAVGLSET
ncbi:MAG: PDZ domain-containing protein, partial [Aquincola sp.]|nr:PDZ domain-containing protein [Aquincola sp.]